MTEQPNELAAIAQALTALATAHTRVACALEALAAAYCTEHELDRGEMTSVFNALVLRGFFDQDDPVTSESLGRAS